MIFYTKYQKCHSPVQNTSFDTFGTKISRLIREIRSLILDRISMQTLIRARMQSGRFVKIKFIWKILIDHTNQGDALYEAACRALARSTKLAALVILKFFALPLALISGIENRRTYQNYLMISK